MDMPDLHDATLVDLSLQWGERSTLVARFRQGARRFVALTVFDVKLLHCPHENPWGPSVSVNRVRSAPGARAGLQRIEIEIQSGDTISVEGERTEWAIENGAA
jgi:hypothetical protein